MHIPKTAGLSLRELIKRRHKMPGSLQLIYDNPEKGFVDSPNLKTVMGHFRFGFHRFSNRPYKYFTLLREPIQHVISHYYYSKDFPGEFENLPDGIDNIIDFAKGPYGYNFQTRFISGIDNIRGHEKEALEVAKNNLKTHFEVVGLTEQFDLSVLMMGKAFGWKIMYYSKSNIGKARQNNPMPSPHETAQLKDLLKYDIELYTFGKDLFEKQLEKQPELLRRLPAFQRENKIFQRLNPTYTKLKQILKK